MISLARRLRDLAAQCRQVTRPPSDGIAAELEGLARDYDRDAARLEASALGLKTAMAPRAAENGRPYGPGRLPRTMAAFLDRWTNRLVTAGVVLAVVGAAGLGLPEFTTLQTREVARIGDLDVQAQESRFYVIPPLFSCGALVLGIILIGGGLYSRR